MVAQMCCTSIDINRNIAHSLCCQDTESETLKQEREQIVQVKTEYICAKLIISLYLNHWQAKSNKLLASGYWLTINII